jgi:hypothetical protein
MLAVRALSSSVLALATIAASDASAQRHASFALERGAETCPDEAAIADRVRERLGYDPFVDWPDIGIEVEVGAAEGGFRATIAVRDTGGRIGERVIEAPSCEEISDDIVLAVSIAIDPELTMGGPAPPDPAPEPPAPEPPPPPEPPAPAEEPVAGTVLLGVTGGLGTTPGFAIGGRIEGGVRWSSFSLAAGATVRIPSSRALDDGEVEGSLVTGDVAACGWLASLYGCGLVSAGAFLGSASGFPGSRSAEAGYAALGLRLGVEGALARYLVFRAQVDLVAPLVSTSLLVGPERVWEMTPVSVELSLAFGLSFS